MEGFNPDQSLIPSVGGSITPMSGGGQRGGEPNPPGTDGHNIVGLDVEGFKQDTMGTIFKLLAPTIFSSVTDLGQYWTDNKNENNSNIKNEIFKTLINTYLKDIEAGLTIETDENVDENHIIEHLVQDTSMSFVDISNTQMKFDIANQLLTIEIITTVPKKPVVGGGMFDSEEDSSDEEGYSESNAERTSFSENDSEEDEGENEDDLYISEVLSEGEFDSESSSDSESE